MNTTIKKIQQNIFFIKKRHFSTSGAQNNNELLEQKEQLITNINTANDKITEANLQIEEFNSQNDEILQENTDLNAVKAQIESQIDNDFGLFGLQQLTQALQNEIEQINEQMQVFEEESENLQSNISETITTVAMQNVNVYSDVNKDYFNLIKFGPAVRSGESITFEVSSPVRIVVPFKYSAVEKFNSEEKHILEIWIKDDVILYTTNANIANEETEILDTKISDEPISIKIGFYEGSCVVYFEKLIQPFWFGFYEPDVLQTEFYVIPPFLNQSIQSTFIDKIVFDEFVIPTNIQFGNLDNNIEQITNEETYPNMFSGNLLKNKYGEIISLEHTENNYCFYFMGQINCYSYLEFEYNVGDVFHIKAAGSSFQTTNYGIIKFTKTHVQIDNNSSGKIAVPTKQTKMRVCVYETDDNKFYLTLEIDETNKISVRKQITGIDNEFEMNMIMYIEQNIVDYKKSERVPKYELKTLTSMFRTYHNNRKLNVLVEDGYIFKFELLVNWTQHFKLTFDIYKTYNVKFKIDSQELLIEYDPNVDESTGLKITHTYNNGTPTLLDNFKTKINNEKFTLYFLSQSRELMVCSFDNINSYGETTFSKLILKNTSIYQTIKITTATSEFDRLELPIIETVYSGYEQILTPPLPLNEYFDDPKFTDILLKDIYLTNCLGIQIGGHIEFEINNSENNIFKIADFECEIFKLVLYDNDAIVEEILCEKGVITPILQDYGQVISKTVFGINGTNSMNFKFFDSKFYVSGEELTYGNTSATDESLMFEVSNPSVKIICMTFFFAATL